MLREYVFYLAGVLTVVAFTFAMWPKIRDVLQRRWMIQLLTLVGQQQKQLEWSQRERERYGWQLADLQRAHAALTRDRDEWRDKHDRMISAAEELRKLARGLGRGRGDTGQEASAA